MNLSFEEKYFTDLTISELYDIMALRQEVFVVEQSCPYLDADGKDKLAWHVIGKNEDGTLVAYARVLPKGVHYKKYVAIGRVVTASNFRKKGLGKKLIVTTLAFIEQQFSKQSIKLSAQTYLIHFYESYGFSIIGDSYLEDDIPHIAMIKTH